MDGRTRYGRPSVRYPNPITPYAESRGDSFRRSPFGCAASEGDSVRGSAREAPARLRFTSLRPPPAATPP